MATSGWGPILVPHSDNLIYNLPRSPQDRRRSLSRTRPIIAWIATANSTGEGPERQRRQCPRSTRARIPSTTMSISADCRRKNKAVPASLKPATTPPADNPQPSARTIAERADLKAIRDYHASIGGKDLRIVRGESPSPHRDQRRRRGRRSLDDMWRYAIDAASMDWIGNGDHDNGNGREYTWWLTQKTTDASIFPAPSSPCSATSAA